MLGFHPCEEAPMAEKPILTIYNQHYEGCGTPPTLDTSKGFTAYLQNDLGEQIIMQQDKEGTCRLWMGDVGWEEELRVVAFRGQPVIVFARSEAEQKAEFKMSKQFEWQHERAHSEDSEERIKAIRQDFYAYLRKHWGKPRLTDEECEFLCHHPTLNQHECAMICAVWHAWND